MKEDLLEDIDPFFIESWEDFCAWCIREGKLDFFKKTLSFYIEETNEPIKKRINDYITFLQGEIWRSNEGNSKVAFIRKKLGKKSELD